MGRRRTESKLGEVAKNHSLTLKRLLLRLKIGKVSELKNRFLVMRGKLRTTRNPLRERRYLLEFNGQCLCLIPGCLTQNASAANVFLPFAGDAALSIILSKAPLLLDDDQTILRQIR